MNRIRILILLNFFVFTNFIFAQSNYQKAWDYLDNMDLDSSMKWFEEALDEPANREQALLCLTMLHSINGSEDAALEYFDTFYQLSEDPYPAMYALWFEEGVFGAMGKMPEKKVDLLKRSLIDERVNGKQEGALLYRMYFHYLMSGEKEKALQSISKIKNMTEWQLVGPFDNVMNSGYPKNFGVVDQPESTTTFTSKYGAKVKWFTPPTKENNGYFSMEHHFYNANSIVYAQNFVDIPTDMQIYIKMGYSGSLRLWINDKEIYYNAQHMVTEMDFFSFKCDLKKGVNRILVQLGDHEETYPNFTMRITDMDHQPLELPVSTSFKPYNVGLVKAERMPHFALSHLKDGAKDGDLLNSFLLVKAYFRSNELNKAESLLEKISKGREDNYLFLRQKVLLYSKSGDDTNQSKYYQLYADRYAYSKEVLENEIEEFVDAEEKKKYNEAVEIYNRKYPDDLKKVGFQMGAVALDDDTEKTLSAIDEFYDKYPDNYTAVSTKYEIEKSYYSDVEKANHILEKYLESNFSFEVIQELANNYAESGNLNKAISIHKRGMNHSPEYHEGARNIVNILSRQKEYQKAIDLCLDIIKRKPSDNAVLKDLGILYTSLGDKAKAKKYYKEALKYFPFSFDANERVRELDDMPLALDLIQPYEVDDIITEFEASFDPKKKMSYDVVCEQDSWVHYESSAKGRRHLYILRVNDASAIKYWQNITFYASSYMSLYFDELMTIKKDGTKITAERSKGDVVFTNLEIGDYLFVSYHEKQTKGGKSSLFFNEHFDFNSSYSSYRSEYNVFVEDGVKINYELLRDDLRPTVIDTLGFTHYQWVMTNPELIEDENNDLPNSDLSKRLHISTDYTWEDVVHWYSDLSSHQAVADFAIKDIVKNLIGEKSYNPEEKAKIIYDFVCENIQYSNVDFRQSSYIPQLASRVYHDRLGDCKDVSTLYASIAREAGLKCNLVLINTSNNGLTNVMLPSLNFNHCIVRVYLPDGPKYLELTDNNLPYGHLYYYHQNAAILEIPADGAVSAIELERMTLNTGFQSDCHRISDVRVLANNEMLIDKQTIKTGRRATSMVSSYYDNDEKKQMDDLKKSISKDHSSNITLNSFDMSQLRPRLDTARYAYNYSVKDDVLKLGGFGAIKLPFSDLLIHRSVMESEKRINDIDFVKYENTNHYTEEMIITLDGGRMFKELPKDVYEEFGDFMYDLKFTKISDGVIKVSRKYRAIHENITPERYPAFRTFMNAVYEAENTHVLF